MGHILHRWQILQVLGALMLLATATYSQTATAPPAARTAEVEKLGAFLGEWRMKDDPPDSPNRTICQWSPNGRCLLCDQIHPGPNGSVKELNIFTYDRAHSAYVMKGLRPARSAPFSVDGQTWTYPGEYAENGKTIKTRVLNTWESPTVMHYTVQASADAGTQWKTNVEGRMVRAADSPSAVSGSGDAALMADLSALTGTWRLAGTRKATPLGPGGPISSVSTCQWSPNGAFLVCDQLSDDADLLVIYSASAAQTVEGRPIYQVQRLNPEGGALERLTTTRNDRTWTYSMAPSAPADDVHRGVRIVKILTSPTFMTATEEITLDGGKTWMRRAEWTETKGK